MRTRRAHALIAIAALCLLPLIGPPATMQQPPKRPIAISDVIAWKTLGTPTLSNDGEWFAYRSLPQEGDGEVVVRRVRADKEMRFPIGELPQPVDGAAGGGRGGATG